MARKSKDPKKPSQTFLRETGQATSNENVDAAATEAVAAPATSEEAEILRRAIKDLGGDDSDYELLKGLSDDEQEEVVLEAKPKAKKNQKGQVDEVCILRLPSYPRAGKLISFAFSPGKTQTRAF